MSGGVVVAKVLTTVGTLKQSRDVHSKNECEGGSSRPKPGPFHLLLSVINFSSVVCLRCS